MLQQLLDRIHAGGSMETGRLAVELGTPREILEAMLDHLQRQGLIESFEECGKECQGCDLSQGCARPGKAAIRAWRGRVQGYP